MKSKYVYILGIVASILVIGLAFFVLKPEEEVSLPLEMKEYSSFSCPFCSAFFTTSKELKEEFGDDLEVNFIALPGQDYMTRQATLAAEAAGLQDKYMEYATLLFQNQGNWTEDDLEKYAKDLELDVEKFNTDRASDEVEQLVENDLLLAQEDGITKTPTVFVNGRLVENEDLDYENLKELIQEKIELGKKQAQE